MLTRAQSRRVVSLQDKKDRDRLGLYVVEGDKLVREALALCADVETVYAVAEWIRGAQRVSEASPQPIVQVSPHELQRMSAQKSPNAVLAVVRKPQPDLEWTASASNLTLALDAVRDPGNLGSLLRVAAWFGIEDVVASPDCADAFQPKVVQASMGALFHVRVHSIDLEPFLVGVQSRGLPIYGGVLQGTSIYEADLESRGVILLGNESFGLSEGLLRLASQRLMIPPWRESGPGRDSLNVATAAAVLCSELRRRVARADPC